MSRNRYRVRFHPKALADMVMADGYGREREVGHFFLAEANYPPNLRVPRHSHENTSLYLVLAGSIGESKENRSAEHKPGTLVFTPQDEPHSNYTRGAGGRCFMIDIKRQWLDSVREPSLKLNHSLHFEGGLPLAFARRAYREVCWLDSLSPMVIEGLMLELLAEVSRQKTRPETMRPRWLMQVQEILHASFSDKLSLSELANRVGRHPVHVAAQFRHHYGCSVGDYVRQLRIEFTCREITSSRRSLVEIANAAGFADQGHFCRTFKALIGLTPSDYRTTFGDPKWRQKAFDSPSNASEDVV